MGLTRFMLEPFQLLNRNCYTFLSFKQALLKHFWQNC